MHGRIQDCILPVFDNTNGVVDVALIDRSSATLNGRISNRSPYTLYARLLLPAFEKAALKTCSVRATANLAITACALKRHRLATGKYPTTLAELSPRFLTRVPIDPVNGEPLHYRRTDDGQFILYSIAADMADDGGRVISKPGSSKMAIGCMPGDWVWRYPEPAGK